MKLPSMSSVGTTLTVQKDTVDKSLMAQWLLLCIDASFTEATLKHHMGEFGASTLQHRLDIPKLHTAQKCLLCVMVGQ